MEFMKNNSEPRKRRSRPSFLTGSSKRGDSYLITRGKGGCYSCVKLKGTMLNTYTNKTVAICEEQQIQYAPHPRDGCYLSKPYNNTPSDFRPRKRRLRKND